MTTEVQVDVEDDVPTINPEYDTKAAGPPKGVRFPRGYGESFNDWFKHLTTKSDATVEANLLSLLPFYPESDGKRTGKIINTYIDNKNYIHEFFIENTEAPNQASAKKQDDVKDIVLIHGYGASLGLFLSNYNDLSSIPGIRIHAIDLLGFGFSSRPAFPSFPSNTVEEIKQVEDWFIDSVEQWRKKRGLTNFVLIGHSFGGYLSSCYAMKYHTKENQLLNKLVLVSPVGVERNKYSLLRNIPNPYFNDEDIMKQNKNAHQIELEHEFDQPQTTQPNSIKSKIRGSGDTLKNSTTSESETKIHPKYKDIDMNEDDQAGLSKRRKLINYLWQKNVSPFTFLRILGPFRSKLLSGWTSNRFKEIYQTNEQHYNYVQDYCYRTFFNKGSGEFAITRVLAIGALPKLPLIDRMPQYLAAQNLPSFWMYGDRDWMNVEAGKEMTVEINQLAQENDLGKLAKFKVLSDAGHHLYMDNPKQFKSELFKFMGY